VFVFINYSGRPDLNILHGKAIAIDIDEQHAPFPSIFIVHEMRVRGHNPFQPIQPNLPDVIPWQDWIDGDLFRDMPNPTNTLFRRNHPDDDGDENDGGGDNGGDGGGGDGGDGGGGNGGGGGGGNGGDGGGGADIDDANHNNRNQRNLPRRSGCKARQQKTMAGTSSGTRKLELNAGVIADILAVTHAMPSWKACQMENTSWNGTADENIRKYVSSIGVETSLSSDLNTISSRVR
jgi:hypothetical protein